MACCGLGRAQVSEDYSSRRHDDSAQDRALDRPLGQWDSVHGATAGVRARGDDSAHDKSNRSTGAPPSLRGPPSLAACSSVCATERAEAGSDEEDEEEEQHTPAPPAFGGWSMGRWSQHVRAHLGSQRAEPMQFTRRRPPLNERTQGSRWWHRLKSMVMTPSSPSARSGQVSAAAHSLSVSTNGRAAEAEAAHHEERGSGATTSTTTATPTHSAYFFRNSALSDNDVHTLTPSMGVLDEHAPHDMLRKAGADTHLAPMALGPLPTLAIFKMTHPHLLMEN